MDEELRDRICKQLDRQQKAIDIFFEAIKVIAIDLGSGTIKPHLVAQEAIHEFNKLPVSK